MTFESILFQKQPDRLSGTEVTAPDFLVNLNLDQIIAAVTSGKEEYDLVPFLYMPLHNVDTVLFRHEVMQDLEEPHLFDSIQAFADAVRRVRGHLGQLEKRYYERQKEWSFLEAANLYVDAVSQFLRDLMAERPSSRGLVAFMDYLTHYASSDCYLSLTRESKRLKAALAAIRYSIFIQGSRVEVRHAAATSDYGKEIKATFRRFEQGGAHGHVFKFSDETEMNHIEAQILDGAAYLHPDIFTQLTNYRAIYKDFLDPTVSAFDREIQFYIAYLSFIAPMKRLGLAFCYPDVRDSRKQVHNKDGFDLALANKLMKEGTTPICNEFHLQNAERVIVVSGPNQGGKTTFARTFGQLHYLASLGYPVPGSEAQLYLPDRIFTHFEREEKTTNLRGKLEDDIIRIHAILESATSESIIIINEIFSSTALRDALFLSEKVATRIMGLDALCVWVTFLEEISSLNEKTVSMVSTVAPENPAQRTFKIIRRRADGLAYAMALAEKHRLTYKMIKERIKP